MNGIPRNDTGVALASTPLRITIVEFVRSSSCPFLYAWMDGAWQFVTDMLVRHRSTFQRPAACRCPLDSDEVVVLGPAERFANGKKAARLRVTSELREVIYLRPSEARVCRSSSRHSPCSRSIALLLTASPEFKSPLA